LSVLGGPGGASSDSTAWFPLVGAGLGALLGVAWWFLGEHVEPLAAAAIVVALDAALTGMLHLDGLVDAADGLLPHLTTERRLAVMSEPTIGAFGVLAAVMTIVLRVAALSSAPQLGLAKSVLMLAALWAVSRSVMAFALSRLPSARRAGGLASQFGGTDATSRPAAWPGVVGIAGGLAALIAWNGPTGGATWAASLAGAGGVLLLARRRIGGYTGDVLGAAGVVGETIGLLVAAGRW
jgi:adenosylcobinamide-GDP ribazoletransferase